MAASMINSSRYGVIVVVFLLIFNMYLFQKVIHLNGRNEALEISLQTSLPTTQPEPATVTVTSVVTATTTVTPDTTISTDTQEDEETSDPSDFSESSDLSAITPLLAHQAPSSFPPKIWHKCGPKGVDARAQELMNLWRDRNRNFRHELLTDESADQYVREKYAYWPEVVETYMALNVPILKVDFLRVLILYADGGIWSDLDVTDDVPVSRWIPEDLANDKTHPINVVVGIEFDGWQFCSWTVMSKPHLQHFKAVIEYVLKQLKTLAVTNHVSISGITKAMEYDVVAITGPQAITVALLESVSKETKREFTKKDIHGLKEPTLIGDILVFPQASFAALQGGLPTDQGPYLVSHLYAGSWKNEKGGEEGQVS
ncbi:hypothetical protein BJX61DRAFT_537670 [Aspergillus egyptiacus]|nr:hypothetical protein BJX61DRAFT_537670 [Aspergillus egyptiacus]